jgi:hypothetical protein
MWLYGVQKKRKQGERKGEFLVELAKNRFSGYF